MMTSKTLVIQILYNAERCPLPGWATEFIKKQTGLPGLLRNAHAFHCWREAPKVPTLFRGGGRRGGHVMAGQSLPESVTALTYV